MLVKIEPEKFEVGWDVFAPIVEQALPEDQRGEVPLTNILKSVLLERAHAWVEVSDDRRPRALVVTTFQEDQVMNNKTLLVYTLTVLEEGDTADWKSAIETLRVFARKRDCSSLMLHVQNRQYQRFLEMLGAETAGTIMTFEV